MQIHRFRDTAGIALAGKGETRYMSAEEAETAGRALLAVAESIRRERFSASPPLTTRFETHAETSDVPPQAFALERELAETEAWLTVVNDGAGDSARRPLLEQRKRELESALASIERPAYASDAEGIARDMERRAAGIYCQGGEAWPQYVTEAGPLSVSLSLAGFDWQLDGRSISRPRAFELISERMAARLRDPAPAVGER